ncbi:MAG: MFS transporter [Candidatus Bathyarchaeaceae archaeon]
MPEKEILESHISLRIFLTIFVLLFNAFTWWYMTRKILEDIISNLNISHMQNTTLWAIYYTALIGTSIAGSVLAHKVGRIRFLCFWMTLGIITSLLPMFFNLTIIHASLISFLLGASFGLGMPSCLAYFADHTLIENRGRVGGTTFLITNLSAPFFAGLLMVPNLTIKSITSAVWRGLGLLVFVLLKPEEKFDARTKRNKRFVSILRNKSFIFFFTPWLMFCFLNRLEEPILREFLEPDFYQLITMIEAIVTSFFALIGGLLSDWIGRKRVVIYGFVSLGLAYALIGIASDFLFSWYFYTLIDGIAGGLFMVTFILVLWGDLAQPRIKEEYYIMGNIPFFLADLVRTGATPYITLIPPSAAFSLASFFLFLAVLPLMYAPETLPEKKIELRRLRKYVEAAKKVREKYVGKEA